MGYIVKLSHGMIGVGFFMKFKLGPILTCVAILRELPCLIIFMLACPPYMVYTSKKVDEASMAPLALWNRSIDGFEH